MKRPSMLKDNLYDGLHDPEKGLEPENAKVVGAMTARLILSWNRWLHRRVERVTFCDEDALERDVSLDFTLPRWFHTIRGTTVERKRQLVPLGFLHKAALINFSLRDEGDASLPLLITPQNTQVAEAVLMSLARASIDKARLGPKVPDAVVHDIKGFVRDKPGKDDILAEGLFAGEDAGDVRDALRNEETFLSTAELFWKNFLAISVVEIQLAERRVLHFSYEEARTPASGLSPMIHQALGRPRIMTVSSPSAGEAASYHLEVEAPEGLMIGRCEKDYYKKDEFGNFAPVYKKEVPAGSSRAHCRFGELPPRSEVGVTVKLWPRKSSGVRGATLTAFLALVTSMTVALRYGYIHQNGDPTAATLLLAATGIVGFVVVRSGEEQMATTLLFPLRVLTVVPVVLAVCAALVVIVSPTNWVGYSLLGIITALIAAATGLLICNWHVIRKPASARD